MCNIALIHLTHTQAIIIPHYYISHNNNDRFDVPLCDIFICKIILGLHLKPVGSRLRKEQPLSREFKLTQETTFPSRDSPLNLSWSPRYPFINACKITRRDPRDFHPNSGLVEKDTTLLGNLNWEFLSQNSSPEPRAQLGHLTVYSITRIK